MFRTCKRDCINYLERIKLGRVGSRDIKIISPSGLLCYYVPWNVCYARLDMYISRSLRTSAAVKRELVILINVADIWTYFIKQIPLV